MEVATTNLRMESIVRSAQSSKWIASQCRYVKVFLSSCPRRRVSILKACRLVVMDSGLRQNDASRLT